MKSLKKNYTPATGKCILVRFEAIYELTDIDGMERSLETLREYGAAEVVEKTFIAEDFNTACGILQGRALK